MKPQQVLFLSKDYFALLDARADIASALALGSRVIVVVEGEAYEIIDNGEPAQSVVLPATDVPTATVDQASQPAPGQATPSPTSTGANENQPIDSPIICTAFALPVLLIIYLASVSKRKEP
jgi:hypothetical protein